MGSEKRKRIVEGVQARKKPNAAQVVKISSVRSVKCPPIVATAPGLNVSSSIQFQAYAKQEPTSRRSKKLAGPPPESLMLHSSNSERMEYTATEDGAANYLKHYVGVFDPKTGKLDVIEAKKMTIRGVAKAMAQENKEAEAAERATMMEQKTALGEAFGTKKARKALDSIRENAIAPQSEGKLDATSKAMMESLQDTTKNMATREQLQAAVDDAKPVPPGNFDAEEIQDVYKPHEIIGTDILNAIPIKDWQDAAKKRANLETPYRFISTRFYQLADGPEPVKRLRVLRYLNYMFDFFKSCKPGKMKGTMRLPPREKLIEKMANCPQPVLESIRRRFSENGEMGKFHTELWRTYSCALAAYLANYEFDTSSLRLDMGLDEKQFAMFFKEIGGRITNPAKDKARIQYAKLALPLEFPKTRFVNPKRR